MNSNILNETFSAVTADGTGTIDTTPVTTTFVEDTAVSMSVMPRNAVVDTLPTNHQGIPDFMQKPYLVTSGSWTTGSAQNADLWSNSVSTIVFGNSAWANKISGFNLVRGTVCFRVQINANPFQQGKLLLHFLPVAEEKDAVDPSYLAMHNACIASKRMHPCVEIDCRDTVGVMKVPYITPASFYDVKRNFYDWGIFYLTVLSPLQTGASGETSVNYSIFAHFEDFELSAPIVPQMAGGSSRKYKVTSVAGREAEIASGSQGTISSMLSVGASVANALSDIPFISDIAIPASWILDAGAKVASWFGWSKPENNVNATIVSTQYNRYLATSDGTDNAYPLSLRSDNQVSITTENSLTNEDEMSFSYLKKVSTVLKTISWTTSQGSGTNIYSFLVGPQALFQQITTANTSHTVTMGVGPPIYYLSGAANLWRGGIELVIKFAKTEFHSGRIQVSWTPSSNVAVTPTLSTSTLVIKEIIDIRTGNEFRLKLPWLLNQNYMQLKGVTNTQCSGQLDIIVLNELRCPETASSAVNMLLYYCGADDFEFQNMSANDYYRPIFSPQAGDETLVDETIGGMPSGAVTTMYASQSIGEYFTSIKQLLNRSTIIYPQAIPADANQRLWPWFSGVSYLPSGTAGAHLPLLGGDIYPNLANMYCFYKGSVRTTIVPPNPLYSFVAALDTYDNTAINVLSNGLLNLFGTAQNYLAGNNGGATGFALTDTSVQYATFKIPYYSQYRCSMILNQTTSDYIPSEVSQPQDCINYSCMNNGTGLGDSGYFIYRSFSDDFQLSYFIGCPPLYLSST